MRHDPSCDFTTEGKPKPYEGESDVIVSRVKLTHLADVLSPPKRTISYIGPHGLSRHASPARIAVFNSCFINRGIRAASDVRKSGPIGPVDHLVAARQSVGRERLVRHVTRTTYLPLLFLLLFSLMTITRPSLPLVLVRLSLLLPLSCPLLLRLLLFELLTGDSSRSPRTARYFRSGARRRGGAPTSRPSRSL